MNTSLCTLLSVRVCVHFSASVSLCVKLRYLMRSEEKPFLTPALTDPNPIRLQADNWSDLKHVMCFFQLIEQRIRLRGDALQAVRG